jgi:prepilin-type N-terminal cleavage/methylation domain-containing protein
MRDVGTKNRLPDSGFTLIEALLSSVVIAVCVMAVSAAFYGGMQNLRDEGRILEIVNYAEGKMDELIATDFDDINGGADQVTVQGETVQRLWQATPYDVDGDTAPESDAKLIVVTIEDVELSTLLVDSAGEVTCKR